MAIGGTSSRWPGTARKHRAHVVDGDGAAERLRLRLEPVAHLAVEIGERQPADAAFRRGADLGGLHQVAPQALGIDREVLHAGMIGRGIRSISSTSPASTSASLSRQSLRLSTKVMAESASRPALTTSRPAEIGRLKKMK